MADLYTATVQYAPAWGAILGAVLAAIIARLRLPDSLTGRKAEKDKQYELRLPEASSPYPILADSGEVLVSRLRASVSSVIRTIGTGMVAAGMASGFTVGLIGLSNLGPQVPIWWIFPGLGIELSGAVVYRVGFDLMGRNPHQIRARQLASLWSGEKPETRKREAGLTLDDFHEKK